MSFVNCYDVASMVIDVANSKLEPLWTINSKNLDIFKQYCNVIDSLVKEFNAESLNVEVDEITLKIIITIECEEIIIKSPDHILYELINRTVRYGFSVSEDGRLNVKLVFPSLWDKI